MKLYVIGFTQNGTALAKSICQKNNGAVCFSMKCEEEGVTRVFSLKEWTKTAFLEAEGIVFVGACGIAVRAIAPFLKGKYDDPGVVVTDEKGKFVISLLSGHVGGGNALAKRIAEQICGTAVITTATDVNDVFAVDIWVQKKGYFCQQREEAKNVMKDISAALLDKKTVGFYTPLKYTSLPKGIEAKKEGKIGMTVSVYNEIRPFEKTLSLIVPAIHIGIGCRKNIPPKAVEEAVFLALSEQSIPIEAVEAVATIDLKQYENAIVEFCEKYQKPLHIFTKEELSALEGDFTPSSFVKQTTGVDNVCERAAVCSSLGGDLLLAKTAKKGVTIALAMKKTILSF